jgi:hypothetical protein
MAKTDAHKAAIQTIDSDIEAWQKRRKHYQDDTEFAVIGGEKQWDKAEYARRQAKRLPIITYNQLPPLIRSVKNSIMAKDYAVVVSAQGQGASQDRAEFRGGMIRAIQITGGAIYARETGVSCAVTGGFGFWRIKIVAAPGGKRRIKYERIPNALNVVPDPNATEINFADMKHCTVYADLPKATYKAQWPKGKAVSIGSGDLDVSPEWVNDTTVRVAEFWEIDEESNVFQTIMDGAGVLQERELQPFKSIPIVTLVGEDSDVSGEKVYKGIVRDAREPQQFKNLWKSEEYEYLSGKKQPPALMSAGMVTSPKVLQSWGYDTSNDAFRLYQIDPLNPGAVPLFPPAPEIPAGYANASQDASQEIKVATGLFDGRLGAQTQETSGRALLVRQEQANVADAHIELHLKAAIEYEGKILNEILGIFSDEELIEFAGEDGEITQKEIKEIEGLREDLAGFNGGAYGIRVTVGQNHKTKNEAFLSMIDGLGAKNPVMYQSMTPEIIRAMGIPGGDALASEIKRLLVKQGMREDDQDAAKAQIPPAMLQQIEQAKAALEQMGQQIEQLSQENQALQQVAEGKAAQIQADQQAALVKAQMDAQAALERARLESATKIETARIQADTDRQVALIKRQTELEIAGMKEEGSTTRQAMKAEADTDAALLTALTSSTSATAAEDDDMEPPEAGYGPIAYEGAP